MGYRMTRWIDGKSVSGEWNNGVWTPDPVGYGEPKERVNKTRRQRIMRNKFKNAYGQTPYQKWDEKTRSYYWAGGTWDKRKRRWREAAKNWEPSAPLYFAYGSNLNLKQMSYRAPEASPFGKIEMPDWKLVFRGVADIEAAPGESVQGGLWRITGADELALDRYEGVKSGNYVKDYFTVTYTTKAGAQVEERCLVYLMGRDRGQSAPYKGYLESIQQGYKDFDLDPTKLAQAVATAEAIDEAEREARRQAYKSNYGRRWGKAYDGVQDDDYDPMGQPYGRWWD